MHAIFIPYGKRSEVELMLRDMEAQKHKLKMFKDDKVIYVWIQGQVRLMPFGVYEYVFPKEDMNKVLTTLRFDEDRYSLGKGKLALLRKMIKAEPTPKYEKKDKYLWIKDNVMIIPIGVRYDGEFVESQGVYEGYIHEAI